LQVLLELEKVTQRRHQLYASRSTSSGAHFHRNHRRKEKQQRRLQQPTLENFLPRDYDLKDLPLETSALRELQGEILTFKLHPSHDQC